MGLASQEVASQGRSRRGGLPGAASHGRPPIGSLTGVTFKRGGLPESGLTRAAAPGWLRRGSLTEAALQRWGGRQVVFPCRAVAPRLSKASHPNAAARW